MNKDKLVIYHNPICSKSRETPQILQDNNQDPEIIEYLQQPPSKQALQEIIKMLGISARDYLRTGEQACRDAGLEDDSLGDDQIIAAICEYLSLLQRPIVISGNRAVIGRPPVKVLEIIA